MKNALRNQEKQTDVPNKLILAGHILAITSGALITIGNLLLLLHEDQLPKGPLPPFFAAPPLDDLYQPSNHSRFDS